MSICIKKALQPIDVNLLVAIRSILILLSKYKDDNGKQISASYDEETGDLHEISEAEAYFYYSLHNDLLWNRKSLEGYIEHPKQVMPRMYLLLELLYKSGIDVECSVHLKNHEEKLEELKWFQELLKSDAKGRKIANEALCKGDFNTNLLDAGNFICKLFEERERLKSLHIYELKTGVPSELPFLYYDFVSISFLEQKEELLVFLSEYLKNYLHAFRDQDVDWGSNNVVKYDKQEEAMRYELQMQQKNYGAKFWVRLYCSPSKDTRRIETLFAMEDSGLIAIEEIKVKEAGTGIILARVNVHKLFSDNVHAKKGGLVEPSKANEQEVYRKGNEIYIGQNSLSDYLISQPQKDILKTVLNKCKKGEGINWDEIFESIGGPDVGLDKDTMIKARISMNDSRRAINRNASSLAEKDIEVIGLIKRQGIYICKY